MAKVPGNDGLDWGLFPTKTDFPNEPGSAIQSADLVVGARAYAADSGPYVCAVATVGAATWITAGTGTDAADIVYIPTTPGDWPNPDPTDVQTGLDSLASQVAGLGGGAAIVGPYTKTAVAVGTDYCNFGTFQAGWIAPRAGSVTAVSGVLSAAAADDSITMTVAVGITNTITAVIDDTESAAYATAAAGTHAVAAGDIVFMTVTGGASLSNTPDFVGTFEFTPS